MSEESSKSTTCICDPSVVWSDKDTSIWGTDCFVIGCKIYQALFLLIFLLPTIEGARRIWINRSKYRTAVYISNFQLTFGCLLFTIRQAMMLGDLTEPISFAVLLTFGFSFFFSAYLFILMLWCEIIRSINFSGIIQRVFPFIRILIIVLNVILFAGFTISVIIWWPYNVTNAFNSFYGFGVTLGFAIFGFIIYREFQKIKEANRASQRGRELRKRVNRVVRLSASASLTAILLTLIMVLASLWFPRSAREMVAWLFVNRFALALFSYTMYICLKGSMKSPNKKKGNGDGGDDEELGKQRKKDAQWVKKNQDHIFTNASSSGNEVFVSGKIFMDDDIDDKNGQQQKQQQIVYQQHQMMNVAELNYNATIGSLDIPISTSHTINDNNNNTLQLDTLQSIPEIDTSSSPPNHNNLEDNMSGNMDI